MHRIISVLLYDISLRYQYIQLKSLAKYVANSLNWMITPKFFHGTITLTGNLELSSLASCHPIVAIDSTVTVGM